MNNSLMFSSANQAWDTPQGFYDELNKEFHFDWDLAACEKSAKCEKYYTKEQNTLKQRWEGMCFLNPPYGRELPKFIKKSYEESRSGQSSIVMLIPARTDTRAFHKYIWDKERNTWRQGVDGRFLEGRLTFGSDEYWEWVYTQEYLNGKKNTLFGNTKGKRNAAPFPSIVVIFNI